MKWNSDNKIVTQLIGLIGLFIVGYFMTAGLKTAMDIFFLDETGYLVRGTKMFGKIPKHWGPLYCGWYRILYIFENNLIELFYLNFKLMSILPVGILFLALSRFTSSVLLALFVSLCFLISALNLPVYPKISLFCMGLIASALLFSSYTKSLFYKGLIFLSAAMFLSFARPEFYLSFLLIAVSMLILFIIKQIEFKRSYLPALTVFLLVAVVFHYILGNPLLMKVAGQNRSIIAFGEHFAFNYKNWTNSELYTWLAWKDIFAEHFGEASSLTEAMKSNPEQFWKHIGSNIGLFLSSFFTLISALVLPIKLPASFAVILGVLVFIVSVFVLFTQFKKVMKPEFFFLKILAIPTIISCVLVYPRNHYLVLLVPITSLFVLQIFHFIKEENGIKLYSSAIVLIALFVLLGPKASDFRYFEIRKEEGVLNNQLAIQIFRNAKFETPISMLSNEGDFSAFAKKEISWIVPSNKKEQPFSEFLKITAPDVIYLTESIYKNPYYANDTSWLSFLNNFEQTGYEKLILDENIQEHFLVKQPLINKFDQ